MSVQIVTNPKHGTDVIIAGAGPAGSAAAIHLARLGIHVVLLEKKSFPRDKVCGDFVGPVGLVELKKLGITSHPEYKKTSIIRQASVYLNGEKLINEDFPDIDGIPAHGRVIPRKQLDQWLFEEAQNAGVDTFENVEVTGFQADADSVSVDVVYEKKKATLKAGLLIGADGSRSIIARCLGAFNAKSSRDRIVAIRSYFSGADPIQGQAELFFSDHTFPGYYWFFPAGSRFANVGVGMMNNILPDRPHNLRKLLLTVIREDTVLRERLRGAEPVGPIRAWPLATYNHRTPVVGHRVILVGDAAGLINPINGEGIQTALLSARWAAEVAAPCIASGKLDQASLNAYKRKVNDELRCDMALSRIIVQLIRNQNLNPIWFTALRLITTAAKRDPLYSEIAGGILAGMVPAQRAIGKRMIGGTAVQAARSFAFRAIPKTIMKPSLIGSLGIEGASMGFKTMYDGVRHPRQSLQWGSEVLAGVVELGAQVAKTTLKS
ncbi:MAG: geranylgeranyl reductase family protein [Deltaproteobacteria bacterium]|nr:geranylgeranyl reductase family protein [Deltaproteobacteria bacterium]